MDKPKEFLNVINHHFQIWTLDGGVDHDVSSDNVPFSLFSSK